MPLVRAEIEIDASPERIWPILVDLERYGEWNPFTPRVESTLELGDPVHLYVRLGREKPAHRVEIVSAVEAPHKLSWGMRMLTPGLLAAERRQLLEPVGEARTRYVSEDEITGLLAPIVMRFFGHAMQRGFEACAEALKKRAEA